MTLIPCRVAAGLLAAVALCACASAPPPPPPPPPEPVLFTEDLVDLLPDLQGVLHLNVPRLRAEKAIFDRLLARALERADTEEEADTLRALAEHTDTLLVGLGRRVSDDPELMLVLRTKGKPLVDGGGVTFGTPTTRSKDGFRRAKISEDDLVLVDDYTAILFEPGLRTGIEALLANKPGRRFRDAPAYRSLADDVAFGSAPIAMLGSLPPGTLQRLAAKAPPALAPLTQALGTVHSYGAQLDIGERITLRVLAQGEGSSSVALLAGAMLVLKNAVANNGDDPKLAALARRLRIEARGNVLELTYEIGRAELMKRLDEWLADGPEDPPPPKGSEI